MRTVSRQRLAGRPLRAALEREGKWHDGTLLVGGRLRYGCTRRYFVA